MKLPRTKPGQRKIDRYVRIRDPRTHAQVSSSSTNLRPVEELERIRPQGPSKHIPKHIWAGIEEVYERTSFPDVDPIEKPLDQPPSERADEAHLAEKRVEEINYATNIENRKLEQIIGEAAARVALSTHANTIVSIEKSEHTDNTGLYVKVSVFKNAGGEFDKIEYHTRVRRSMPGSVLPIKDVLSEAVHRKFIEKNDRVVCVEDEAVSMGFKGMLFVFDVDDFFFTISRASLPESVHSEILEAVVSVAQEIAAEGREGQHVGTTFIIGNKDEILAHTRQIIINPFRNYPVDERLITDVSLKETIKSFAQLDGAFVIDENGTIETAGAMISNTIVGIEPVEMPGFGTRHTSAATLTKAIGCIAIVVSSSGGAVRIFKDGKMLMRVC
ncbi:MAG: DNA integrity scanning protein DisA nucleotide-binding domain protein [Candidatus Woesearchaeota archaeon]